MVSDNGVTTPTTSAARSDDGHGRAALVLVESLIHGLHERSILGHDDVVEIVERAVSVQTALDDDADGTPTVVDAGTLLALIAQSLRTDDRNANAGDGVAE